MSVCLVSLITDCIDRGLEIYIYETNPFLGGEVVDNRTVTQGPHTVTIVQEVMGIVGPLSIQLSFLPQQKLEQDRSTSHRHRKFGNEFTVEGFIRINYIV